MDNQAKSSKDFKDGILREQVRLVMQQVPSMQGTSFIVALVLCYVVRDIASHVRILEWLMMVLLIVVARIVLYYRFRKVREGPFAGEYWKNIFIIMALISGIIWGLSAFMIFPAGNPGLISFFLLALAGLSAGTTISHSSIRMGPTVWAGPALLPSAVRCLMEGGEFGYTAAFLTILYLFAILRHSFTHNNSIISSIALRFENLELIEEVQKANDTLRRGIVERKQAEEALRVSNKALMDHAAKLERLNEELQDFAFVASHDLQEPLRKIQTFCDLAVKRCSPALDSAGREYLDRIARSAGRMRQLLDDLLRFSMVATRPEPFKGIDLGKVARKAADLFEEDLKKSGGLVEIESMPDIEADEDQMLRLFQYLIVNALKFRSEESPRIKIHARHDRGRCEIFVEDNGIGFDQKFAERIFKPFQRLHGRNEYEGTGMGLAMCRKIVEWHGGHIRVESKPGKGATFIIGLPVKHDRRKGI